jgi:hypothetical protein
VYVYEGIEAPSMLRLIRRTGLREDVANIRFELGVESSAAEPEQVLVVVRMLNS